MLTLILETTLPDALIALYDDASGQLWEQWDAQPRSSERLHAHLANLLATAHHTLLDVNRVVVTQGPGSFTGIRVGLAIAQALQMATQAKIVPLTTLQALALSHPAEGPVTVLIDSLGQEVFTQTFANGQAVDAPQCLTVAETEVYTADKTHLIGNGVAKLGKAAAPGQVNPHILATADLPAVTPTPLYLKPLNYRKVSGK